MQAIFFVIFCTALAWSPIFLLHLLDNVSSDGFLDIGNL